MEHVQLHADVQDVPWPRWLSRVGCDIAQGSRSQCRSCAFSLQSDMAGIAGILQVNCHRRRSWACLLVQEVYLKSTLKEHRLKAKIRGESQRQEQSDASA